MIIATAGHVDHGKTRLVEALTGVDTDTLAEEKKRGLSINIGFAYLPVTGAPSIGFIDVPGHDRFIKNALCGLAAADFVLLVVAADDGPMPQTREHLSIVGLLGLRRGAIVVTKTDRVSASRLEALQQELDQLTATTGLASWPAWWVSSSTGRGIDALRERLVRLAQAATNPPVDAGDERNFRLAVDRCFEVKGAGLVVTGTVFAGSVGLDELVTIAGTGMQLRVRGLRVHDAEAKRAYRGQRCALNLAGSELRKEKIRRGCWVTAAGVVAPVSRFDAEIRIVNDSPNALTHWTPVHLHLAAAESTARVAVLEAGPIKPGDTGLVQLVSDIPLGAVFGDRFIIRDQSARRTVGGGRVLDIFPPRRGRARGERIRCLRQMNQQDDLAALQALLAVSTDGVDLEQFSENRNRIRPIDPDRVDAMQIVSVNNRKVGFARQIVGTFCDRMMQGLRHCHQQYPQASGFSEARWRAQLELKLSPGLFRGCVDHLLQQSQIKRDAGGYALMARSSPGLQDDVSWRALEAALARNGLRPMTLLELAAIVQLPSARLNAIIAAAVRAGLVVRLAPTLLVLPPVLNELHRLIEQLAGQDGQQSFTVAEFRDASGIGRNRCIETLECFDARGITLREGQARRMQPTAPQALAKLCQAAG